MSWARLSVAMTGDLEAVLRRHLLRGDGQEDLCLATYAPSTGATRTSSLLREVLLPESGERAVHGNASFTGDYVLRAVTTAARDGLGVALLHSHPRGTGWQGTSPVDADAESSYANLAYSVTGLPLLGLTLAGNDRSWSARRWDAGGNRADAESVRVIDAQLRVSWNDRLCPPPRAQATQIRTISGWGEKVQAGLARLHVLVVGAGSVGLDVALRLAATGIEHVAVMDFDSLEVVNLDRLPSATPVDIALYRGKAEHAMRHLRVAATAAAADPHAYEDSICEEHGQHVALDYDVIFSCVDRPWPRAVLNQLAYSDLIPVIDGGIAIDAFDDGDGMRNATWRSHVLRPGRPCLVCNRQLDPAEVALDQQSLLDDPEYIRSSGIKEPARQNVAALSISVAASQLAQFISLTVAPGGIAEPGPLQYVLSTHELHRPHAVDGTGCHYEQLTGQGDARAILTGSHGRAEHARTERRERQQSGMIRLARAADDLLVAARSKLTSLSGLRTA